MNSKELGAYLREARLLKSISLEQLVKGTIYSMSDFENFENGTKKCPLKVMTKYLSDLDTCFWYKCKKGTGKLSFEGYFTIFKTTPRKVPTLTTFDFLKHLNKNEIQISLDKNDFPSAYSFQSFPDYSITEITNEISMSLKKSMTEQKIDLATLAKSILLSKEALDNFLCNVVDYDFSFIEAICRKCALKLIVKTYNNSRFSIVKKNDGLYKEINVNNRKEHSLIKPGIKMPITEVARSLQELNYKSLHFSILNGVNVECRRKPTSKTNSKAKKKKKEKEQRPYIKFISVPMGGQNKKY